MDQQHLTRTAERIVDAADEPSDVDRAEMDLQLARETAVDAVMAQLLSHRPDKRHEAERAVDVVLDACAHLIAAAAGRLTPGMYAAHWEGCWRLHADCAVLEVGRRERQGEIAESLGKAEAAALRMLLRELDGAKPLGLTDEMRARLRRAAADDDPLTDRMVELGQVLLATRR